MCLRPQDRSFRSSTRCSPTLATSRAWSSRFRPFHRTCGGSLRSSSQATQHSLVLLDELGAGTDPAEGAALGRAILDELDSIGCRSIVTTHIGDLKSYALANPRAENAAVEFDVETLQPRYRLHIGDVGQSNALQIARRLGLAGHVVNRAEAYLDQGRGTVMPAEWELVAQAAQGSRGSTAGCPCRPGRGRAHARGTRSAACRPPARDPPR